MPNLGLSMIIRSPYLQPGSVGGRRYISGRSPRGVAIQFGFTTVQSVTNLDVAVRG